MFAWPLAGMEAVNGLPTGCCAPPNSLPSEIDISLNSARLAACAIGSSDAALKTAVPALMVVMLVSPRPPGPASQGPWTSRRRGGSRDGPYRGSP